MITFVLSEMMKAGLVFSHRIINWVRPCECVSFIHVCVCVPQECGCDRLHAGDGRVSVRRRRQAGDVSERVPGQRGLQQGGLLQSVRAGCGLHPQAAGQSSRVSRAGVWAVTWCVWMKSKWILSVSVMFGPQGPAQRRRVYEPPLAVAAVLSEPRPRRHPHRPREELRHQVGRPARRPRRQGELPGVASLSRKKVSLRRGNAGCCRRWLLRKSNLKGERELLKSFKPPEYQLSAARHSKYLWCLYSTNLQKIDHSDQR